jgi:hypothetical protein
MDTSRIDWLPGHEAVASDAMEEEAFRRGGAATLKRAT